MFEITDELKERIAAAMFAGRDNFSGSDAAYATSLGINKSVYSTLKSGKREGLLTAAKWLNLARQLSIPTSGRTWNAARTEVFEQIEEEILFCKEHSKSMIFVDDCGIGKTFTAKYLSQKLQNCFYLDCSQCKNAREFIRTLARTVGVDTTGKISSVKADIKYCLNYLPAPVVVCDEAGDLSQEAWLDLKELWNATPGCGWYLMGAQGLRAKIDRGRKNARVGFAEMFSRLGENYSSAVPRDKTEKLEFYRKLITDVLSVNMADKQQLKDILNRCLKVDKDTGHIGGLRRAESLLILNS